MIPSQSIDNRLSPDLEPVISSSVFRLSPGLCFSPYTPVERASQFSTTWFCAFLVELLFRLVKTGIFAASTTSNPSFV